MENLNVKMNKQSGMLVMQLKQITNDEKFSKSIINGF